MNGITLSAKTRSIVWISLLAVIALAFQTTAFAQKQTAPLSVKSAPGAPPSAVATIDPFVEIKKEIDAGKGAKLNFTSTDAAKSAKGTAQVSIKDNALLVRLQAKSMPQPASFNVPRYAVWVYVPNHDAKFYIGDLPIQVTKKDTGITDTAYRFAALPPNSVFGGLVVTAEPVRYEALVSEALRPVLVALVPEVDPKNVASSITVYGGPMPVKK